MAIKVFGGKCDEIEQLIMADEGNKKITQVSVTAWLSTLHHIFTLIKNTCIPNKREL